MNDIELLPLPEPNYKWMGYTAREAEAIARANVAHATAAKDAEIEALRAELREAWSAVDSKAGWEWKKRAERLAETLQLARDLVEDWAGYAGEYFQKKHNLEGDLALLDAALRDHDQEGDQ